MRSRLIVVLVVVALVMLTAAATTAIAKPRTDWNTAATALAHYMERLEYLNSADCTVAIMGSGTVTRADMLEVTIHCERKFVPAP